MSKLGKNISYLRKQNKYSQISLGNKVGVSQTSIAHYENGSRQPTIETLIALSETFNESIDSLIGHSLDNNKEDFYSLSDNEVIDLLVECLISKDERLFFQIFENNFLQKYDISVIIESILKKILFNIGYLWETGIITEADEHYSTNIVRKLVNYLSIKNTSVIKNKTAISFSISSEKHTLGMEMINTYLETLGVKALYLGNNLPIRSLENTIKEIRPNYIFISITLNDHINNLVHLVEYLHEKYGGK